MLEVALDNIKGKGLYGGKILSQADLDVWAKTLLKKYGTKLEKVDSFDNPEILAQFDSNTNTILYKDDVTEYIMLHESFHAEEMSKIGFAEYVKEATLKGTVFPGGYTDANLLRSYKRELYVYEKMMKIAEKKKFTHYEIINISYNVDLYILLLRKRGINIIL